VNAVMLAINLNTKNSTKYHDFYRFSQFNLYPTETTSHVDSVPKRPGLHLKSLRRKMPGGRPGRLGTLHVGSSLREFCPGLEFRILCPKFIAWTGRTIEMPGCHRFGTAIDVGNGVGGYNRHGGYNII
jgi:hypothetical protein